MSNNNNTSPTVKHTPLESLPKSERFWNDKKASNSEIELLRQILQELKILNEKLGSISIETKEEEPNRWR